MDKNKFKYTHIPVHYQKTKELDERFLQVKVYVLHTGENYNGSIFEKEVVNNAIPSLALTPLLAFVKMNENEKDFAGHEIDLVVEKGEYKWKYKGQAYGVIPENNNARWEFMTGSDGVEREYLVADAIVWKKFDDAVDILSRDLIKGQSMELSDKYSGHFNDDGLFVFDQFKFDGCAILGDGVEPAMNSAKVEMQFSMANLKDSISEMLKEYHSKFQKEVENVNIEALLKQYELTRDQVIEAGVEIHTYSDDNLEEFKEELERIKRELENKDENKQENQDNLEDQNKDQKQDQDVEDNKDKSDFDKDQNKSEDDKDELQKDQKDDKEDFEGSSKNDEKPENSKSDQANEENDNKENELKDKFEKLQKDYKEIVAERDELVKYKKNRERNDHKAKVEALISSFDKLNENDVKEIREKVFHFSISEIEEKLYAILGKKQASEKVKKQTEFAKFYVSDSDDKSNKGKSYDHLFEKHLKK